MKSFAEIGRFLFTGIGTGLPVLGWTISEAGRLTERGLLFSAEVAAAAMAIYAFCRIASSPRV